MRKVVLIAFAVSPYRGSEYAVAWNFITNMSKTNELFVFLGTTTPGVIGNFTDIEKWEKLNTNKNIHFVQTPLKITFWTKLLSKARKYNTRIPFYFEYKLWHKTVFQKIKQIIKSENISLIHYLSPIGFKEPGYCWKINKPYLWGPIQGVQNRPFVLYRALGLVGIVDAVFRKIFHNLFLYKSHRLKKALYNTDVLLSATPLTKKQFKLIHKKDSFYLPENAIIKMHSTIAKEYKKNETLELIWIGALIPRKGLILLLKALNSLKNDEKSKIHLSIVGSGKEQKKLEKYIRKVGLNKTVSFIGLVNRDEVFNLFDKSHLHVITSLGDATTTVLWEAMSNAVPTMSLNHCGMAGVICDKCGIKIPIKSYTQVINDIAKEISDILHNTKRIEYLSKGVLECSKNFMWDQKRVDYFNNIYANILRNPHKG